MKVIITCCFMCYITQPIKVITIFSISLIFRYFIYSKQTLLKIAEAYGEDGRAVFIKTHWSFDLAFPIIYTIFFLLVTSYLIKKTGRTNSAYSILNLAPLATMDGRISLPKSRLESWLR